MAKSSELSLLDSVNLSGIPQTRKGVNEALQNKLREKYGLGKNVNVHAALTYGSYLKRHRVYSSKAGGYIHNESSRYAGQPWDEKAIRAELKSDSSAALQTHRAAHPLSIAGRKIAGSLQRISKFSNAQDARNALSDHLQAKSQNWWQLRNLASTLDQDTGLRLYELNWENRRKVLEERVNLLENKDISDKYEVPKDALRILEPKPFKLSGQEVGRIVGGDSNQVALEDQNNTGQNIGQTSITKDNQSQSPGEVQGQGELVTEQSKGVTQPITQPVRGSLKRWTRGSGESLDAADARTEAWLTQQGYDHTKISKYDKREVYRDLRARGPWVVGDTLKLGGTNRMNQYNLKINKPVETVTS